MTDDWPRVPAEIKQVADEHGWTLHSDDLGVARFRSGTRRLTVVYDIQGRVMTATTARSYGPRRGTKAWALEVLRGERPSGRPARSPQER